MWEDKPGEDRVENVGRAVYFLVVVVKKNSGQRPEWMKGEICVVHSMCMWMCT